MSLQSNTFRESVLMTDMDRISSNMKSMTESFAMMGNHRDQQLQALEWQRNYNAAQQQLVELQSAYNKSAADSYNLRMEMEHQRQVLFALRLTSPAGNLSMQEYKLKQHEEQLLQMQQLQQVQQFQQQQLYHQQVQHAQLRRLQDMQLNNVNLSLSFASSADLDQRSNLFPLNASPSMPSAMLLQKQRSDPNIANNNVSVGNFNGINDDISSRPMDTAHNATSPFSSPSLSTSTLASTSPSHSTSSRGINKDSPYANSRRRQRVSVSEKTTNSSTSSNNSLSISANSSMINSRQSSAKTVIGVNKNRGQSSSSETGVDKISSSRGKGTPGTSLRKLSGSKTTQPKSTTDTDDVSDSEAEGDADIEGRANMHSDEDDEEEENLEEIIKESEKVKNSKKKISSSEQQMRKDGCRQCGTGTCAVM
jgi:hypothetical protein